MNVLKDSLLAGRVAFYSRCIGVFLWMGGFALLYSLSWKAALGVFLVTWGIAVERK